MTLNAILWDYDGTLVNSAPKNMEITKSILSIVAPHLTGANLPKYLHSEVLYHEANHAAKNWQELYLDYYGLTYDEMLVAGSMWAEHQEKNETKVTLFDGIKTVIERFARLPQGICSQNSQKNIRRVLFNYEVDTRFHSIVGYDDVPNSSQKPHPFSGIKCVESLLNNVDSRLLMYIGDHQADVQFARNLQNALGQKSKVISVAAAYSHSEPKTWQWQPDYIAYNVEDLISIIGQYTD